MARTGMISMVAGVVVAGAAFGALQLWRPPMFVLKQLGATDQHQPPPQDPRHVLAVRVEHAFTPGADADRYSAATAAIANVQTVTDAAGVHVWAQSRSTLEASLRPVAAALGDQEIMVGPAAREGIDGWRDYVLDKQPVIVATADVAAARVTPAAPDGTAGVTLELTAHGRDSVAAFTRKSPKANAAVVVDGAVAAGGPIASVAGGGALHLVAAEPLDTDAMRIAARFGGAPVPVDKTTLAAARLIPALAAGLIALALVRLLTRR